MKKNEAQLAAENAHLYSESGGGKAVLMVLFLILGSVAAAQWTEASIEKGARVISYDPELAQHDESLWFLLCSGTCLTVPQYISPRFYINNSSQTDWHDLVITVHVDTETLGEYFLAQRPHPQPPMLTLDDRGFVLEELERRERGRVHAFVQKHGKLLVEKCRQPKDASVSRIAPQNIVEDLQQQLKPSGLRVVGVWCQVGS